MIAPPSFFQHGQSRWGTGVFACQRAFGDGDEAAINSQAQTIPTSRQARPREANETMNRPLVLTCSRRPLGGTSFYRAGGRPKPRRLIHDSSTMEAPAFAAKPASRSPTEGSNDWFEHLATIPPRSNRTDLL